MFSNFNNLFKYFCLLLIYTHQTFGSAITIDSNHEKDVINYINAIKKNIDTTINPCDDFAKYACGHIESLDKPANIWNIRSLIEKFFIDRSPITKNEEIVRDFILDCDKFNEKESHNNKIKAIFEQIKYLQPYKSFPIEENTEITSKEISELEAILNTLGQGVLVKAFRPPPSNKQEILHFSFGSKFEVFDFNDVTGLVRSNLYNKSPEESYEKETTNMFKFINESQIIKAKLKESSITNSEEFYSFEDIQKKVQLKNMDWPVYQQTFIEALHLENKQGQLKFVIENNNLTEEFVNLYNSSDIKTIANLQILQLINFFTSHQCIHLAEIGRFAVLHKLWNDNLNSEITIERYKTFLNDFEIFYKNSIERLDIDFETDYIEMLLNNTRYVLDNHSTFITEEILNDHYKNYKIGKFYENILIYFHNMLTEILDHYFEKDSKQLSLFLGTYDSAIDLNIKDKPYLYYYNELNFALWYQFFRVNTIVENITAITECLNQFDSNNFTSYETQIFLQTHASITFIMTHYFTNNRLPNEFKISKNLLNSGKLFFVSLAQKFCQNFHFDKNEPSFFALTSFEEFNDAFSCHRNNNKICKIETCDNDFKNVLELLPHYVEMKCSDKN